MAGVVLQAQTTVHLRAGPPAGFQIVGATDGAPIVIQTSSAHGLNQGDVVSISGVCASDGLYNLSSANGIRKVKSVPDATHFSITDLNGKDIAGNGAWCTGANSAAGLPGGAQFGGKLTGFPLAPGPRGWLDGTNGDKTRQLALGTQNGLTNLLVSGNVATVTTSYNHGVQVGDHVTVWNTASPALNHGGNDYSVIAATAQTFQFPTNGVGDGDYTRNTACGPGAAPDGTVHGTDNCVRISQLAVSTNPYWTRMMAYTASRLTGGSYRHWADGGTSGSGSADAERYAEFALAFLVDQANQSYLTALLYGLNRVERLGGVNFMANEAVPNGGNRDSGGDFASYVFVDMAIAYSTGSPYLTPAQRTTFLDKMYNDLGDATPCTKTYPIQTILATATAQAGSRTGITLAASDPQASGYYVNNVIVAIAGTSQTIGLVTAYDGWSKIATVVSWSNGAPSAGSPYAIYATISRDGNRITGHNTSFTSSVSAGDMVYGENTWATMTPENSGSYVTSVNSDTSLTVINGPFVTADGTPSVFWQGKQWQAGDCGLRRLQKYWPGYLGSQPISYPPQGAFMTGNGVYGIYYGANNWYTWAQGHILFDLAVADDDPRAVPDLAQVQTAFFDYLLRVSLNYTTGFSQSGDSYQWDRTTYDGPAGTWAISHSVVGYPSLDTTGPMMSAMSLVKIYDSMPDTPYVSSTGGHTQYLAHWGDSTGAGWLLPNNQQSVDYWAMDHGMAFNPTAASSQYLKSFITAKNLNNYVGSLAIAETALKIDPRINPSDYTVQPRQYLFSATSHATCAKLTGWPCPATFRADAFISRTGWSSPTDTFLFFQARNYFGDHDLAQPGQIQLYKAGFLLATDSLPPGIGRANNGGNLSFSTAGSTIEFNGGDTFKRGETYNEVSAANIIRWASANHGSWDEAYGDQNSNYVYALADFTGAYQTAYRRVQRHLVHFKKPGTEEIIVQFDDVDASNYPTQIRSQIHYPQNGEKVASTPNGSCIYDEGTTTCPGPNGCAGLDMDRLILEQEDGGSSNGDPPRAYNLVTRVLSPGTIFVRDDGSAFPGAQGHTHRVSICAGSNCDSAADTLEAIIVHKVATQPDTNLNARLLTDDWKWTGVQTQDKVALFARSGNTPMTATIRTDHPGTAQYLIAGLQGGLVYRVYRVGAPRPPGSGAMSREPVPGHDMVRQRVADGDNTLYFEGPAGEYLVFPEKMSGLIVGNGPEPRL